jgi:phosphoglycolate phosphatase-like HAD superfamily hydrolase
VPYTPRVLVDFDGVIHAYSRGWDDGSAYDAPMPGAREALERLVADGYEVVIFSTRDLGQIAEWLERHDFPAYRPTNYKEPAVAQIDDRAIRFVDWSQALAEMRDRYPAAGA